MIRNIEKNEKQLSVVSNDCSSSDLYIKNDLLDTIKMYKNQCVGMAANMIGYHKNAIIFWDEQISDYTVMFNPSIIQKKSEYSINEGCLSLSGERNTLRYQFIKVSFLDESFKKRIKSYQGFVAEIIQHEIDHCKGIII